MNGMLVFRKGDNDPVEYLLEAQPGDVCMYHDGSGYRAALISEIHNGRKHRWVVTQSRTVRIGKKRYEVAKRRRVPFNSIEWIRRPRRNRRSS